MRTGVGTEGAGTAVKRRRLFWTTLVAITLLGPLTLHLFLPALPAVQRDLAVSTALAQAALSLAIATMAATTVVYGSLSDRFGRRPVLLGGLALFTVGMGISVVATDIVTLLIGRIVQAAGAGCGIVIARAMVRDVFGDANLAKYISYLTVPYVLGPMLAPILGGLLIDAHGWRAMFVVSLATGIGVLILAVFCLSETHLERRRGQGFAGLVAGYSILIRSRRFTALTLQTAFSTGAFYALISSASFLVNDVLGEPTATFGLYFMTLPIGYLLGNLISGRIGGRVGPERLVVIGSMIAFVVVCLHVWLLFDGPMSVASLIIPGALMTFGQGLSMPNAQAIAIASEPHLTGTASGLLVFVQMGIGAVFAQLVGIFADKTFLPMLTLMLIGTALALVVAIIGAGARRPQPST
ncbi:MAG: multidrug effflux MFS transporter [Alphaproteobacteria bacterium]|nr:multidrug effflux MFS transporter [Alphaproteobacteria bacterium]